MTISLKTEDHKAAETDRTMLLIYENQCTHASVVACSQKVSLPHPSTHPLSCKSSLSSA